jgi:FtsZ-interacting cell division protein YlmF
MNDYYTPPANHYVDDKLASSPYYQSLEPAAVAEIVIIEPTSFNDIPDAIDALRQRQMVVLNLTHMEHAEAQRSVDFLAGGTIMFNGTLEKIDQRIFIFAPPSTEIIADGPSRENHNHLEHGSNQHNDTAIAHAFSRDRLLYRAS